MFCACCQKILDLGILISTWAPDKPDGPKAKPYPHHESFIALEASAEAGCELCKLAVSTVRRHAVEQLRLMEPRDAQLWFQLSPDNELSFKTTHGAFHPDFRASFYSGIQLRALEGLKNSQTILYKQDTH